MRFPLVHARQDLHFLHEIIHMTGSQLHAID